MRFPGRLLVDEGVCIAVATILLGAACLKVVSLTHNTEPLLLFFAGAGSLAEGTTALWLLSGINSRLCWFWTAFLFSLFALLTVAKISFGDSTCGCFGDFSPAPIYTLILDVVVLGMIFTYLRCFAQLVAPRQSELGRVVVRVGACICLVMFSAHAFTQSIENSASFVVLFESNDESLRLPIDFVSDVGILSGSWTVILYRPGCHKCDIEIARQLRAAPHGEDNVLLLSLSSDDSRNCTVRSVIALGIYWETLPDDFKWTGQVPFIARLVDGIAVKS